MNNMRAATFPAARKAQGGFGRKTAYAIAPVPTIAIAKAATIAANATASRTAASRRQLALKTRGNQRLGKRLSDAR